MNHDDISPILGSWFHSSNEVTVRRIDGLDGSPKIQMRLELGLLQMEVSGRPDGQRPHEFESLLEYHRDRLERYVRRNGSEDGFELDEDACSEMRSEAMQYYYRYLSQFHLGDYESVLQDTRRNMEAFDFVRDHAEDVGDRFSLEQFRPYVMMMHTRGSACIHLEAKEFDRALELIDEGIEEIESYLREGGRDDMVDSCRELQFLEEWRERVRANRPVPIAEKLRQELRMAVEDENYERAAELRDQIKAMVY